MILIGKSALYGEYVPRHGELLPGTSKWQYGHQVRVRMLLPGSAQEVKVEVMLGIAAR